MIAYLAPGFGRGKPTGATAICRHFAGLDVVVHRDCDSGNEILDAHGLAWTLEPPDGQADITVVDCMPRAPRHLGWPIVGEVRMIYRAVRSLRTPGALSIEHYTPEGMLDGWPLLLEELLPRDEAREQLGVELDEPLVCWIESTPCPGSVLEVAAAEAAARGARLVQLEGSPCMRAADLLVCASGVNTHTEAICAGVPVRWVPCDRTQDQIARLTVPVVRAPRPDQSARVARWVVNGDTRGLEPERTFPIERPRVERDT